MTDRLPELSERSLEIIEAHPIIPLGNVYSDDNPLDYAFDNYVNVTLDKYSEVRYQHYKFEIPGHKIRVMCFSQIEEYMNTVEHPDFTNVPWTGTQLFRYKQANRSPTRLEPPAIAHFVPQSFSLALGIRKEIQKSLKVVKKITKKDNTILTRAKSLLLTLP